MTTYNAKALRRLMAETNHTYQQLAAKAKVAPGTVRMIEAGVSVPRADTLAALANALSATPADFFSEK